MLILVGAIALSAAAIYNGYPFFFFDTHAYYTGGEKSLGAVLDLACNAGLGCGGAAAGDPIQGDVSVGSDDAAARPGASGTTSTGRSPFYGIFVYLAAHEASIWLIVAAQALLASWLLHLTGRLVLGEASSLGFLGTVVVVAALSSAPFFVGYLMPDIFAGLYILAMAVLITFRERLTWIELIALWALLVCSMLFHRSHVLTAALVLGLVGLFVLIFERRQLRRLAPSLALVGVAVGIGAIGFVMLDLAVTKMTGRLATPPPFLLARVIEDGPGTSYLKDACGEEGYVVCRFVDRMPISEHDFLWSKEAGAGVWYVVSPEERTQIAREQYEIVLRSFLHDPLTQIGAIAGNFGQQLIDFSLASFTADDLLKSFVAESFGGEQADRFLRSRIAGDGLDLHTLSVLYYLVVGGAFLLLLLRFRTLDPALRTLVAIVFAGIVLNALVTGSISTPFPRFQARVIWLVPALAAIVELRRLLRRPAPA
jgi:hypothetical protein